MLASGGRMARREIAEDDRVVAPPEQLRTESGGGREMTDGRLEELEDTEQIVRGAADRTIASVEDAEGTAEGNSIGGIFRELTRET